MCFFYTLEVLFLLHLNFSTLATTTNSTNIAAPTSAEFAENIVPVKSSKKTAVASKKKVASTEVKIEKKKPAKKQEEAKLLKQEIAETPVKKAKKVAVDKKESATKATKTTTTPKPKAAKKKAKISVVTVTFQLRFNTNFGQTLFVTGNHHILGNNDIQNAVPLAFVNNNLWSVSLPFSVESKTPVIYNYILKNNDGSVSYDWGKDKTIELSTAAHAEMVIVDSWNHAGYYENAFYSVPFQEVLLKQNETFIDVPTPLKYTHSFKVKAPLLAKGETVCLVGSHQLLGNWSQENCILLAKNKSSVYHHVQLDLSAVDGHVEYKYGVYNVEEKRFVRFEDGANRVLFTNNNTDILLVANDGFIHLPTTFWKGAGVAIPVFSLKTNDSFGVGEFTDIHLLVDWSKKVGLKLIQILPINDTIATHTWVDSYPYAAISAFALHPLYLNVRKVANAKNQSIVEAFNSEKERLNALSDVSYEAVLNAKLSIVKQLYTLQKTETFKQTAYKQYFNQNKHWLVPYACFCYLRDMYKTADFNQWPTCQTYKEEEIAALIDETGDVYEQVALHYFIQYHLHLQLKAATEYAHQNGVVVKGDIAIGIYRYGADAWQQPNLYNMHLQAGAPPDGFAIKGQNWGFPTYNWQQMKQDGFAWWKQRFEQMSYYFDAFRIDHILGFFRIWSIPMHAVEGIMGYFVPALPVHRNEFIEKGIWFDYNRYTKPFITDNVLWEMFGYDNDYVKNNFLNYDGFNNYTLKPEFDTQRKVEAYFAQQEHNNFNDKMKYGLFDLISNVILFVADNSNHDAFHFRFNMVNTSSYRYLEASTKHQLNELYINYFFRRQDNFWKQEAMQKLPALKRVTNMLVCGEDLGLVPDCVPDVMKQLGLLSLEIQRMPKDNTKDFFHPNDAPYLSVVTPSTHDMSTIRGWWEEDKSKIQKFYNHDLGIWGEAPFFCSDDINKAVVSQHLYSPAMWSIFQLQDILGINSIVRRQNPHDERINVPANPKNYWKYRMHLTLEQLLSNTDFNNEFSEMIEKSGRK